MNLARIKIVGIVILGVCLCDIGAKAQTKPLSLSIETDNPSVKPGVEISIKILLKNNTDQSIRLSKMKTSGDGSFEYKVDVERVDHDVVAKKYVEKLRRKEVQLAIPPVGSVQFFTIQPGETDKDSVNISNRYEFDKPGKYLVQIERALPEDLGGGVIKSNTITITVTP
jgi:hypothetical protein